MMTTQIEELDLHGENKLTQTSEIFPAKSDVIYVSIVPICITDGHRMLHDLNCVIQSLIALEQSSQSKLIFFSIKTEKYVQQALNRKKTNEYTKMVKAIGKRRKSIAENDPIRQRMLKERQEHARRQDNDYSHVFR